MIALSLALWLVKTSDNGLMTLLSFEEVRSAFQETDKGDLEEACFELKNFEFASVTPTIGHPVMLISPTYKLFWEFDPIFIGTNPTDDAAVIAQIMIDDRNMASIHRLHEKLGLAEKTPKPGRRAAYAVLPNVRGDPERLSSLGFLDQRRRPFPTSSVSSRVCEHCTLWFLLKNQRVPVDRHDLDHSSR